MRKKPKVVGVGELLWDVLPSGPRMGGAPANFACHAAALGAEAAVISCLGTDESGDQLAELLARRGVSTEGVTRDPGYPTGTVNVKMSASGHPAFEIVPQVAWDHIPVTAQIEHLAATADAICFGTLGQRGAASRESICHLLEAAPVTTLKVFDVNLRQKFFDREIIESSLQRADVCKLSDEELPVIASLCGIVGGLRRQLEQLIFRYDLKLVVYTRGAEGSVLTNREEWIEQAAVPTIVRDTVGAGDSFTAAVTMGLLLGRPLDRIGRAAAEIAAYVCSQHGAVPELPRDLLTEWID